MIKRGVNLIDYSAFLECLKSYLMVEANTIASSEMVLSICGGNTSNKLFLKVKKVKRSKWKEVF